MRVKAVIAYDGSFFRGFQKQTKTQNTITTAIESALKSLHIHSDTVGSGRTDTGVHATGQVIHFDLPDFWVDLERLQRELNRKLKHIRIKHITQTSDTFHARFSAKRRIYRYIFKRQRPSIFEENHIAHYPAFDTRRVQQALQAFEGEHDFRYFYKTGSHAHTTIREIYKTNYKQFGDYHILYFEANGFLRAQVRMMIDAAMKCANGDITLKMLKEQIDTTHHHTTSLAPPSGLYLARIIYG
ncbi:MAG: tRNA pseudouridine(38-40) synthase TruA [Campylobacterota bacterium]|nr:tRNA pseudouridine(38-40) synthase TruA [Campylobacterota bacterium]